MNSQPYVRRLHAFLPSVIRTAAEIDEWIGEESGWTASKTGVETRHVAGPDETVARMGARVALEIMCLERLSFSDIDAIVFASASKDQFLPSSAALVAHELGEKAAGIPSFDIDASCLSFVMALDLMSRAMSTGMFQRILLVTSEKPSTGLHHEYKEVAGLFGDAATAAILECGDAPRPNAPGITRVLHSTFETWADGAHDTEVKVGTSYNPNTDYHDLNPDDFRFMMDGARVYRLAAQTLPPFLYRFFNETGMGLADFDYVIPHQASKPAVELLARKMDVAPGMYAQDYRRYGNTVAASIPLSLLRAQEEGVVKRGDRVLLVGTAAGLTLGAMAIEV